ncbi:hypothetical protein NDU88_012430 [Pleurodeles waltl]|uniref:Uncharacterized protein n=1 Tax=Pleurodeles waltl TaxID=8319 RepID=A0AAV7R4L3_PLEWA|nr:hypothetical protein NDU88_012430 [Pleurodeles waltl]
MFYFSLPLPAARCRPSPSLAGEKRSQGLIAEAGSAIKGEECTAGSDGLWWRLLRTLLAAGLLSTAVGTYTFPSRTLLRVSFRAHGCVAVSQLLEGHAPDTFHT